MGEITLKVPRLRRIAGRWFWRPTPAIKKLGFAAEALGIDDAVAIARAQKLNADVAAANAGADLPRPRTVAELVRLYEKDDAYTRLRDTTRAQYDSVLRAIVAYAGRRLVASIGRQDLRETLRTIREGRGAATMINHMRIWRILFGMAQRELGWITTNPAERLGLAHPPKRSRTWTESEFTAFCKAAVDDGRPSLRLAALLARTIGPRRADICRLSRTAWRPAERALRLRETKGGKLVAVPVDLELAKAIAAAITANADATTIVVSEKTGRPYSPTDLSHEVARVRRLAKIEREGEVPPTLHDMRRTMLTELGDAGATESEMVSVTGQTRETLAIYVQPTTAQAESAMRKRAAARRRAARTKARGDAGE